MTTTVYVVGTAESLKTNRWLAMTNSEESAKGLLETLEGATTIKAVTVQPKYQGGRIRAKNS